MGAFAWRQFRANFLCPPFFSARGGLWDNRPYVVYPF
jgi:hypothetical protein